MCHMLKMSLCNKERGKVRNKMERDAYFDSRSSSAETGDRGGQWCRSEWISLILPQSQLGALAKILGRLYT